VLNCDTSKIAVGSILGQIIDNKLRPIKFFSKRLTQAQSKYSSTKLELFGLFSSVKYFKDYLYGRKFIVLCDHKPLAYDIKLESMPGNEARMLMFLSEFEYEFQHIEGNKNILADFLSRVIDSQSETNDGTNIVINTQIKNSVFQESVGVIRQESNVNIKTHETEGQKEVHTKLTCDKNELTIENIKIHSMNDEDIKNIRSQIENKNVTKQVGERYYIDEENDLLMHLGKLEANEEFKKKIVVPKILIKEVIRTYHLTHAGADKTFSLIREKYFWQGMYRDTRNYVLSCKECARVKPNRQKHRAFGIVPVVSNINERLCADIVGPFGNGKSILTLLDDFSRRLELYVIDNIKAETIVEKLLHYFTTFGTVTQILTDRGTNFTSRIFQLINKQIGVKTYLTSSRNPRCNGRLERIHFALKRTIYALQNDGVDFNIAAHLHKSYYNNMVHPATKYAPNDLYFGRKLNLISEPMRLTETDEDLNYNVFYNKIKETLMKSSKAAKENLVMTQKRQNLTQANKSVKTDLKIGQNVFLDMSTKFRQQFSGPYIITKINGPNNVTVESRFDDNRYVKKVNTARIKIIPVRLDHLN
jgi:transposase InsO family protein